MTDLESCRLCEWRCSADRLRGERGVCRTGRAEVAATICSAPLTSYIVTLLGCCYRCLHCNAYRISQYPDPGWHYAGYVPPAALVADAREQIAAFPGPRIRTIGFTGGDPIVHLPYIEEVAAEVGRQGLGVGIGISTGGFATPETMERIVDLCSVITLEIKAWSDPVHRALTGAPVGPVLRNAASLVREGRDAIRVFRTVVIPGMTDGEVGAIAGFIASLDPSVPYRLIGFRPNNVLYYHPGPSREEMERLCGVCRDAGLEDVAWSGYYPEAVPDEVGAGAARFTAAYGGDPAAALTAAYAAACGCPTHPRNCGSCPLRDRCPATLKEPWRGR
ncbi:radical SAM protein [Methanoculleus sp. FWC-SCC1]|uniref:Radical SAM protein n=1 Tax=Methanoculleus frigidifontis TaxID=2584085 RepID=A0ABT8M782_9EURY|nr:radical SAM protein [Methanoculleus sp. FWC-SCC1]MDN7023792.1 radical SAM protein [Methanoculleus sp. FWC-SCC1]